MQYTSWTATTMACLGFLHARTAALLPIVPTPSPRYAFTMPYSGCTDTTTFSNYETMFRYVKPKFISLLLLEKHMPLEQVLQDEAVGMAFPVDSQYFDQFPLIFDGKDVAGV